MSGPYSAIYNLKPDYEDIENGGIGWWKLKWRPIFRETYSFYYAKFKLGGFYYKDDANNGWNRSYKKRHFRLWRFHFWIAYDFLVHESGPLDVGIENMRPLNIERKLK